MKINLDRDIKYDKNKIVIFDWGGVIESHKDGEYNLDKAIISFIKALKPGVDELSILDRFYKAIRFKEKKLEDTFKKLNEKERMIFKYERIKEEFKIESNYDTYYNTYIEEFDKIYYYKEVVEVAHDIKKYCLTGILSNLGEIDKVRLDKQVNLNKFDYVWLSCDEGFRKPEEKIYQIVENECNIKTNNILFIDDSKENIEVAKKRGWNVCNAYGYEINKIIDSIINFLYKK